MFLRQKHVVNSLMKLAPGSKILLIKFRTLTAGFTAAYFVSHWTQTLSAIFFLHMISSEQNGAFLYIVPCLMPFLNFCWTFPNDTDLSDLCIVGTCDTAEVAKGLG